MNNSMYRIKLKGYNLTEFLEVTGISLSSYRRYEKEDCKYNSFLSQLIDELKVKLSDELEVK